jgi:hypothetical protein
MQFCLHLLQARLPQFPYNRPTIPHHVPCGFSANMPGKPEAQGSDVYASTHILVSDPVYHPACLSIILLAYLTLHRASLSCPSEVSSLTGFAIPWISLEERAARHSTGRVHTPTHNPTHITQLHACHHSYLPSGSRSTPVSPASPPPNTLSSSHVSTPVGGFMKVV